MKWIFILIFFQLSDSWAGESADLNAFLTHSHCTRQIKSLLESWNAKNQWQEDFRQKHRPLAIKTPTNQLGTWIFLQKNENSKQISARRISPNTQLQVSWAWPDYSQKLANLVVADKNKSDVAEKSEIPNFDDLSLQKLLDENKGGIIYALSSHMHLSLEAVPIIQKVAEQLNLKLTILVDSEDSKVKNKESFFPVMNSQELLFRGMSIHYPSIILYSKNGKFSGIYPGRKSEKEYLDFANGFLK